MCVCVYVCACAVAVDIITIHQQTEEMEKESLEQVRKMVDAFRETETYAKLKSGVQVRDICSPLCFLIKLLLLMQRIPHADRPSGNKPCTHYHTNACTVSHRLSCRRYVCS